MANNAVANTGFELGGAREVCQRWGEGRKAWKVLTVEVYVTFLACCFYTKPYKFLGTARCKLCIEIILQIHY